MKLKQILALVLSLAMLITTLPAFSLSAAAEETHEKNITLGTSAVASGYEAGNKWDYVYYGTYGNEPLKWRVLSKNGNGGTYKDSEGNSVAAAPMFLLSEYALEGRNFESNYFSDGDGQRSSNDWQYSDAQAWCRDSFAVSSFSDAEKSHVLKTTKTDRIDRFYGVTWELYGAGHAGQLADDTAFLISAEEASAYLGSVSGDEGLKAVNKSGTGVSWWFRSARYGYVEYNVGYVDSTGTVDGASPRGNFYMRPAFNMNPSSVLFTTPAEGGKPEGFNAVIDYTGSEYKLTLLDESRNFEIVDKPADVKVNEIVTLKYTGAKTGENEYISAMLVDNKSSEILYYGQLGNVTGESGSVDFNAICGEYTLKVFNEQINGDKKTDLSSAFTDIEFNVPHSYDSDKICTACGMDENGSFCIRTADQFIAFANYVNMGNRSANAILMNDIDLTEYYETHGNIIIGSSAVRYSGTFDGGGNTLTVNLNGEENVAPFSYLNGATIKNLIVAGTVKASGKFASGIASHTYGDTTIEKCIVDVTIESSVSGDGTHGGFVGVAEEGNLTISSCAFIGEMNGADTTSCGGFIGWANKSYYVSSSVKIENSYLAAAFGVKSDSSHTIARNFGTFINVTDFYYLNALNETPVSAEIIQKTENQFASGEITYLLNGGVTDGSQVWYQTIDKDSFPVFKGETVYAFAPCQVYSNTKPTGEKQHEYNENGICSNCGAAYQAAVQSGGVYEISNAGQLLWFAELVNNGNKTANAVLTDNIDLKGREWKTICSTGLYYNTTSYSDSGYAGTFDGAGYVIKNLTAKGVTGKKESYGLFGTLSGTVKNLGIDNFTFDLNGAADVRAGAVVGQIIGGTVSDCYVLNSTITPNSYVVGGIAGCNYAGTINSCYTYNTSISGSANRFGQITGDNRGDSSASDRPGTMENCYSNNSPLIGERTGAKNDASQKSAEEFASGEVAYLLQGERSEHIWGQNIGTDDYPQLGGSIVYRNGNCKDTLYSSEMGSYIDHPGYDNNGFCTLCGAYQPAVQNDEVYEISNAGQLLWFAELVNREAKNAHAVLKDDINLTGIASWKLIETYDGVFDGMGHSITGLNRDAGLANEKSFGFIKILSGTVKNLTFDNAYVDGQSSIGQGIIVYNNSGTISGCMVINSGITLGNLQGLGLIAGKNLAGGVIENCGAVSSTMSRRYSGINSQTMGGITEINNGTVRSCYTYGCTLVSGTTSNGALIANGNAPENSCYYTTSTTVTTYGTSKTAEQFASGEAAYLLGEAWGQTIDTDAYPLLGDDKVYKYINEFLNELKFGFAELGADSKSVKVNISEAGTYTVIFADYEDGKLINLDPVTDDFEVGSATVTSEKDMTLGEGDRIMLWDSLTSLRPICGAWVITE